MGEYDFKVAQYVCPNHTDDGIYSDHGYLRGHLGDLPRARTTLKFTFFIFVILGY